jgi:hypothetical protein
VPDGGEDTTGSRTSRSQEEVPLSAVPSFTDAVRSVAGALRTDAPGHSLLNRAASRIDGLGRRLHGLGFVHDREIADCFTAAIGELSAAHTVPQEERTEAVRRAIGHLDEAVTRMEAGGIAP